MRHASRILAGAILFAGTGIVVVVPTAQAQTMAVSVTASESRIRDANVAEEAAALTKFNILTQSGLAALAQANSSSSAVLSLLR